MRLFEGQEVEGEFKGALTLFVEGLVSFDVIRAKLFAAQEAGRPYEQVYFGARYQGRNASPCSVNTAVALASKASEHPALARLTIDVRDDTTLMSAIKASVRDNRIYVMVTLQYLNKATTAQILYGVRGWSVSDRIQVKLRGSAGGVLVANLRSFRDNAKTEMKEDRIIWPASTT